MAYALFQGGESGRRSRSWSAFAVGFSNDFVAHDAVSSEKERQSKGFAEKMKPLILTELGMPTAKKIPAEKMPPASQRLHLPVRVVPGAARTVAVGMLGQALKIRLAAVPEDGAANRALCKWVKAALAAQHIQAVQVLTGSSSRSKLLALDFADAAPSAQQVCHSLLQA